MFGRGLLRSLWPTSRSMRPKKGDRVVVAMSGGVDSSVTARLMAEKDYDLSAVFMRNWDTRDESGTDKGCEWEKDWEDVQRVCKMIDLPCEMIDLSREYWNQVFEPSLRMWEQGETPNPDVLCNREIKFGALIDTFLTKKDIQWLATGHYASIDWEHTDQGERPKLVRPIDDSKDQTYYLSNVRESSLSRTIFPLEYARKSHVRELAQKYNLPTANREESMGICFVGEKRRFNDFLSQYIRHAPGKIYDMENNRYLGEHSGLWQYTIGQKARIPGMPEQMVVADKIVEENVLYVTRKSRVADLQTERINVRDFKWIWEDAPPLLSTPFPAFVQIRYRSSAVSCQVWRPKGFLDTELTIEFDKPQEGVSPGQVAAIYDIRNEWCMGSGTITKHNPLSQDTSR